MEKTCLCCKRRFMAHPAGRHQRYCSDPECQKTRKRNWQKLSELHGEDFLYLTKGAENSKIEIILRRSAFIRVPLFRARVAELADALDLGSSGETFRGSTPLSRTKFITREVRGG